jgi:anti-anti-sigma factor
VRWNGEKENYSVEDISSFPAWFSEVRRSWMEQTKIIVRMGRWIIRLDVRGVLDTRTAAMIEEHLNNLKPGKPMPLYINLSNVDDFDSQGLMVLLGILRRLQERYAYIRFVDQSEKNSAALQELGAERILDRLLFDYSYQSVACTAWKMICLILEVSRRVGSARPRDGVESRLIQERRERGGVKSGRISNRDTLQSRTRAGDMLKQAKQGNYGTIVGGEGIV